MREQNDESFEFDVSVVGLGAMGTLMAHALLKQGKRVAIWNRSPGKAASLVAAGAHLCDSVETALVASPATIFVLLWGTTRNVCRRLLDGIEPDLVTRAEHALEHTPGLDRVGVVRLRWSGHRLEGDAVVVLDGHRTLADAESITLEAEARVRRALPKLDAFAVRAATAGRHPTH